MNTQDFRIGNKVFYEGKVQEISSLHTDNTLRLRENKESKCHGCYKVHRIEPIPLTEEILVNWCGFDRKIGYGFVNNRIHGNFFKSIDETYFTYTYYNVRIKINHLHQLQNLYFALTGEELPINHPSAK